jgi:hypothetical protein
LFSRAYSSAPPAEEVAALLSRSLERLKAAIEASRAEAAGLPTQTARPLRRKLLGMQDLQRLAEGYLATLARQGEDGKPLKFEVSSPETGRSVPVALMPGSHQFFADDIDKTLRELEQLRRRIRKEIRS